MNDVLFDYLDDFCIAYLDNIIIYSEDPLKYKCYIRKVLERLYKAGLQVDIKKLEFSVTCIKFLGFIIFINSIKVNLKKVAIIKN
jgi:hypothetical protein